MSGLAKTEARRRGDIGEALAVRYLRRRFYRILERNWFFYRKEIDIIAKRGKALIICEVKTRTQSPDANTPYGTPATAVNAEKQSNLILAAEAYVKRNRWQGNIRMDIIEVYLAPSKNGRKPRATKIIHIKNAFTA